MPRVDFYILEDLSPERLRRAACRVAEKAWQMGHRVYMVTSSAAASAQMDDLLWTFRADSFLPHGRYPVDQGEDLPVLIGNGDAPAGWSDVLINLAPAVPDFHARFQRVADFVSGDEDSRREGRQRFRFYREQGYDVDSHKI